MSADTIEEAEIATSGHSAENPSPFERINEMREEFFETEPEVFSDRAVLLTEAMKETEGEPTIIRRAKGLAHVLRNMPIWIGEKDLVVGNQAPKARGSPVFPEFSFEWLFDEIEGEGAPKLPERDSDPFDIDDETVEELREIREYWEGDTVNDLAREYMPPDVQEATGAYGEAVFLVTNYLFGGVGHISPNYRKVLERGYEDIRAEAQEHLEALGTPSEGDELQRYHFWKSVEIVCDATIDFAERFAELAREKAASTDDEQRQSELERIARNCERVPAEPARDWWEALQSWWFVQIIGQLESSGHSYSPGRFDQYMYPYFEQSVEAGDMDEEFAQELLELVWVKMNEINKVRDYGSTQAFGGYPMFQNLQVGGKTRDGGDATNELSYRCLKASYDTRLFQPSISVRFHDESPDRLWEETIKCSKAGLGMPAMYNDEVIIPAMLNRGRTLEDARDYCIIGCVEPDVPGQEYGWHDAAFFNISKCLNMALNDGRPLNNEDLQLGPETGTLADFESFEEVKSAYETQVEHFVEKLVAADNAIDLAHQERAPLPWLSTVIDPCVDEGQDVTRGGAKYNYTGPQGVGVANVADALSSIQELVFEDESVSGDELLEALRNDWDGYEELHAAVENEVSHYGNGIESVDDLAKWGANVYCKQVEQYENPRGGQFQPGLYPVSGNVPCGAAQGASPDGRSDGEPVADGVSPIHGHDQSGPTAYVQSAAHLDHEIASNGTLLNQRFTPETVKGKSGTQNLQSMMKVFFDNGGLHNQHNIVSSDILRDAQENPEKYQGLVVRVAGYSALFTQLDPDLQEDIIERTEHEF